MLRGVDQARAMPAAHAARAAFTYATTARRGDPALIFDAQPDRALQA